MSNKESGKDTQDFTEELAKKYPYLADQLKDPRIKKILMSEGEAVKELVT